MKLPLLLPTKVVDLVGEERGVIDKAFIIADRTQAKKSACKGAIQSLCGLLRIPLLVLTKGVNESIAVLSYTSFMSWSIVEF